MLRRLPVIWNEVTREDARLFYTIEGLGLTGKLHTEVFREIHQRKRPITAIRNGRVDKAETEKAAREFLLANGVSAADFEKQYRTFPPRTSCARLRTCRGATCWTTRRCSWCTAST